MRHPMVRLRRLPVLSAALVAAAVGISALAAEESSCDRYAVHNVVPGMSPREVHRAMEREPATVEQVPGPFGLATAETYVTGPGVSVLVRYDRDVEEFPGAKVVSAMARIGPAAGEPAEVAASLVAMYGDPVVGKEELDRGLVSGRALWASAECGVVVEAFRDGGDWWAPTPGNLRVEARAKGPGDAPPAGIPAPAAASSARVPPVPIPEACRAPRLPAKFRGMGLHAWVLVRVSVRADGSVADAVALESDRPGLELEGAAVAAVRKWKFVAGTRDGLAEDAVAEVRVEFR